MAPPLEGRSPAVIARTGVILVSYYLATTYMLRILVRFTPKVMYATLVWLMIVWVIPLAVDYVRWWMRGEYSESMLDRPSSFGALGALIQTWTGEPGVATPGIVFQLVLAAVMAAAFHATRRRRALGPAAARD
jgi:hypothetical protein